MDSSCSGPNPELWVTVERISRTAKPDDAEAERIDGRLKAEMLTLDELRGLVLQGATWCPGVFDGKRCGENFVRAQLVAVDMEKGIGPVDALNICKTYDIIPCWGYYSFSHMPSAPRYRLVFRMDHVLGDRRVYEIASTALCRLFKGTADISCIPAASRFYGTVSGDFHFEPDAVASLDGLIEAYEAEMYYRDKTNASKDISGFARYFSLDLASSGVIDLAGSIDLAGPYTIGSLTAELTSPTTGPLVMVPPACYSSGSPATSLPSASVTNLGGGLYIYKSFSQISMYTDATGPMTATGRLEQIPEGTTVNGNCSCKVTTSAKGSGRHRRKLIEDVDFDQFQQRCQLLADFVDGEPLGHLETWGLLTCLAQCKGGESLFKKGMETRLEWQQDSRYRMKWQRQIWRFKAYNLPEHCDKMECRYLNECIHIRTPLDQLPLRRGSTRRIENQQPPVSLAEAEKKCISSITQVLDVRDGAIHLIRMATGLGKTNTLLANRGFILCAPTHMLAKEMMMRAEAMGNDPILVPELPLVDSVFDAAVAECMRIGDTKKARSLVAARIDEADRTRPDMRSPGEQELLEHAEALRQMKAPNGRLVICTHRRLLLMDELPYEIVVFDEDVLFKSQLDVVQVSLHALSVQCLSKLGELIFASPRGVVHTIPDGILPEKARLRTEISQLKNGTPPDNIMRVLDCDRFLMSQAGELIFGRKLPLPAGPTIVVLSATVDVELYKAANPGRDVNLHADITNVEHVGSICQDVSRSVSRTSLNTGVVDAALDAISTVVCDDSVLTMKGYTDKLRNHGLNVHPELHLDNCEGSNKLEGQNMAIIGTPNKSEAAYLMYANLLDIPVYSDDKLDYVPVKRHGWEYWTTAYPNNDRLRHLQLHLVESTLIQAAGRARTLRNNCTCRVFANVIIPGAVINRLATVEPRPIHTHNGVYDREQDGCKFVCARDNNSGTTEFVYRHIGSNALVIRSYVGKELVEVWVTDDAGIELPHGLELYDAVDPVSGTVVRLYNIRIECDMAGGVTHIAGTDAEGCKWDTACHWKKGETVATIIQAESLAA